MSELQAITGQLYIVDGVLQEVAPGDTIPGLLAQPGQPRAARGRERDFLFIHLTLTGAPADTADLSQHLLAVISRHYYGAGGSVTAALRGAVLAANQQLLRHNLGRKSQAREGAITCAAFHQGELFTLQVGESFALLGRNFGIERLPPRPPTLITPLGRSASLDMRYYHQRVQAEDMLMLADPRISHLATDDFNPALVQSNMEGGLAALVRVIGDDSARLLLVEFSTDTPLELPDVPPQPLAQETAAPDPQPRRAATASAAETVTAERKPQPKRAYAARQQPINPPPEATAMTAVDREVVERQARRAGSQAALGASRFTAWLADLLARLRPLPASDPEEEPLNWTWAAVTAVVIPLLVAVIVTTVYLARDQAQLLAEMKIEMSNTLSLAESAGNDAEARHYYATALALAEQINTQLRPGDAAVTRMQSVARTQLDRLDGVTRLTAVPFYEYSEGTQLKAVALREGSNGGIFTLDVANGLVYEHETDEAYRTLSTAEPLRVLFNGQTVGSHVVVHIVDFFWRPQGFSVQREGLAMLDSAGALLTHQPSLGGAFAVPLDLSVEWLNPVAATDFSERLYILDTGARQIWKYFPDGDQFIARANDRAIAFSDDPDLGNAIDFDLYSEDGSLVVLYHDGRIRYYDTRNGRLEWDETVLLANGLNTPLLNPTSVEIVGRGLNATVFIADAGNGRVVQVSRPTGRVLAQYRAIGADGSELFTGLTDFAVAELPLRIFVVKDNILYRATLE